MTGPGQVTTRPNFLQGTWGMQLLTVAVLLHGIVVRIDIGVKYFNKQNPKKTCKGKARQM